MSDKREIFNADAARALLALAATERAPTGLCPTTEEIAAWQAKALSADDAARLDAHVPHCPRCLELWTGMLETSGALEGIGAPAPKSRSSPFSGRWRGAAVAASAVVVFAAAGLLLQQPAERSPLAPYTLQIDDRMRQRGVDVGDDTVVSYGPGDRFELTARPDTAVEDPVQVRVFVDAGAGPVQVSLPGTRMAISGAVQVAGTVGRDIRLPEGSSVLYVVVGRAGELPAVDTVVASLDNRASTAEQNWTAWRFPLNVNPASQP